jgi:hypothetical protein
MRELRLPFAPAGHLEPAGVLLALTALNVPLHPANLHTVAEAMSLAAQVTVREERAGVIVFLVAVDQEIQKEVARLSLRVTWRAGQRVEVLDCSLCPYDDGTCVHAAAVMLAHSWRDEATRKILEVPAWRHALKALMPPSDKPTPKRAAGPTHEGWVRYTLVAETNLDRFKAPAASALDDILERAIVKRSKRTGEALAPAKFPNKLEDAESKVGLSEVDREIDRYFQELRTLQSLGRQRWSGTDGRTARVLDDLVGRALSLLTQVADLRYDDAQVFASPEPVSPRIVVEDGPGENLLLRWSPDIRAVWDAGPGFVLTREGRFQPLHREVSAEIRAHLHEPLPRVPLASAGEFLREIVVEGTLPVDLKARKLPHMRGADVPAQPRLRLAETEGSLTVTPSFVYADADHVREVDVADTSPWVVFGDAGVPGGLPRLGERDAQRETDALRTLTGLCPGPYPATLTGDAALEFLYEVATDGTELKSTWEVLFDARLAGVKSVGRFTPKVSVHSGIDWFDVEVEFRGTGRAKASLGALIAAWRAGRRFVRLSNGAIGRIPAEWLARHGEALEQLEELKAGGDGRLRAFAAPLAAEILGDDGLPEAAKRWRHVAERIRSFERIPEHPLPAGVDATLRDYQLRGYHWLIWLRELGLGGVLADDMGLGKTLQTLALLLDTHGADDGSPSLVVAPTSVVYNWLSEAARFTPGLRTHLHHGAGRARQFPANAQLIVTSYALLRQDESLFRETRFRYVVLDEAQAIKNPTSQIAQTCHALQADHRLAVTGTPAREQLDRAVEPLPLSHAGVLRRPHRLQRALHHAGPEVPGRRGP